MLNDDGAPWKDYPTWRDFFSRHCLFFKLCFGVVWFIRQSDKLFTCRFVVDFTLELSSSMAILGIKEAFARYGASLRNVQWSVSAWAPDGSLVVSLWDHHRRKGMPGALEFAASANRWTGPGNTEFRENVAKAFITSANVRLVIVRTEEVERVEAGEDGSKIRKDFFLRNDLVGKVIEWDGENYAFRFTKT